MIAGPSGDCGKTLVSIGLTAAWRQEGIAVAPFKKGPDYIDAAWLSRAAGAAAHNLDSWMMGVDGVLRSFLAYSQPGSIALVEGNRGLHDGLDARGTHSSAEMAKLLGLPVVLILSAQKMTRTAAAIALGMKLLDPGLHIAGVLLNRVATARQETLLRGAIESETGLPVLGAIPRTEQDLLPGRHLGLITPEDHERADQAVLAACSLIRRSVDLKRLQSVAETSALRAVANPGGMEWIPRPPSDRRALEIAYFDSPAFTFYYPENLEAIDRTGARRIPVDPMKHTALPPVDALYIGGGFPEIHAARLAANTPFRDSIAASVRRGLPVWAECGGLMFLSRSIHWQDSCYPMAGCFPADIVLGDRPAGHGYEEAAADRENPFVPPGTTIRGHEFHYSRIVDCGPVQTAMEVRRGVGLGNGRDGMIRHRVLASYLHVHSVASPGWANWLIQAAMQYRQEKDLQTFNGE